MRSWTVQEEIKLLRSVIKHKPAGVNRHFHLIAILEEINKGIENSRDRLTSEDILEKLRLLYDLDLIDKRYDNQSPPQDSEDGKDGFKLPYKTYGELMVKRAISEDPNADMTEADINFNTEGHSPANSKREAEENDEDMTDSEVFEVKDDNDKLEEEILDDAGQHLETPESKDKKVEFKLDNTKEADGKRNEESADEEIEERVDEEPAKSRRTSPRLLSTKNTQQTTTTENVQINREKEGLETVQQSEQGDEQEDGQDNGQEDEQDDEQDEQDKQYEVVKKEPEPHKPTTRSQKQKNLLGSDTDPESVINESSTRESTPHSENEINQSDHPSHHLRKSTRRKTAIVETSVKKRKVSQLSATSTETEESTPITRRKTRQSEASEEKETAPEETKTPSKKRGRQRRQQETVENKLTDNEKAEDQVVEDSGEEEGDHEGEDATETDEVEQSEDQVSGPDDEEMEEENEEEQEEQEEQEQEEQEEEVEEEEDVESHRQNEENEAPAPRRSGRKAQTEAPPVTPKRVGRPPKKMKAEELPATTPPRRGRVSKKPEADTPPPAAKTRSKSNAEDTPVARRRTVRKK